MKKIIVGILALLLVIYIGGFFFSSWAQELLIYPSPNRTNENCERKIAEKTVEHNETTLYHQSVENADEVIVFYHGNGNIVCDMVFVADIFNENDISYIFPEYTGYSDDGNKSTHEGVLKNVQDTADYIEQQDYEHVYVIGQSIGTGAAAYHTTLQEVEKLLLISPFTTLTDVIYEMVPLYPRIFIENFFVDLFNNKLRLQDYKGDLLIIHGTNDLVIDISQGLELFESTSARQKEFLSAEGFGHANIVESDEIIKVINDISQQE
ncbi:MAG: alpha/beta hydrolase [Candidatus Moraniibacteriota bacterium]|jgi:uncharacterized protein